MENIKHITGCKTCGNIIFDGTPGEIYEAEKHEEECKNFEYEDLFMCTNCHVIAASEDDICDCQVPDVYHIGITEEQIEKL